MDASTGPVPSATSAVSSQPSSNNIEMDVDLMKPHTAPMKMKTFPWKLHEMLELADQEGYEKIVSWLPDGRSFKVYDPKEFVQKIMPNFFLQSKYKSFQRQLNLWGFERLANGPGKGGYSHPHFFFREDRYQIYKMQRKKIKGNSPQPSSSSSLISDKSKSKSTKQQQVEKAEEQQRPLSQLVKIVAPTNPTTNTPRFCKSKNNTKIHKNLNKVTKKANSSGGGGVSKKSNTKRKKVASSSAASVISQGSSDCELSPVMPPHTLTTHSITVPIDNAESGDDGFNNDSTKNTCKSATARSGVSSLNIKLPMLDNFDLEFESNNEWLSPADLQLIAKKEDHGGHQPQSFCPQTGDFMDFEGRNYFFLDEKEIATTNNTACNIDLLRNPPLRRVSNYEEDHQKRLLQNKHHHQPLPLPSQPLSHPPYVPVSPLSVSVSSVLESTRVSPPPHPTMQQQRHRHCAMQPAPPLVTPNAALLGPRPSSSFQFTTTNMLSEIARRRVSVETSFRNNAPVVTSTTFSPQLTYSYNSANASSSKLFHDDKNHKLQEQQQIHDAKKQFKSSEFKGGKIDINRASNIVMNTEEGNNKINERNKGEKIGSKNEDVFRDDDWLIADTIDNMDWSDAAGRATVKNRNTAISTITPTRA